MYYISKEEAQKLVKYTNNRMNHRGDTCLSDSEFKWLQSTKDIRLQDFNDQEKKIYNRIQTKLAIRYRGLEWATQNFNKYLLGYKE